jgi:hypothetical protein
MYKHTAGRHTIHFITFVSISVRWWRRWLSGRKWAPGQKCRRFECRCGGSFAPPSCLRILSYTILAWNGARCMIFVNHCPVSFYHCLQVLLPMILNSLLLQFSDFSARFLISYCVSSIVESKNPPLAISAIFNARRMSDYLGCTPPSCLAREAGMLKPYKKLVAASKMKLRLLPQPYSTLQPPLKCSNPVLSSPGDLYHGVRPASFQTWQPNDVQFCRPCGQMPSSTMKVCRCGQGYIGHGAHYLQHVYSILFADRCLYQYGATHIRLRDAAYYSWVRFNICCWNVIPSLCFRWLELQRRGGLTGVCVAAVSQPRAHWMKRQLFCLIQSESHRAEVDVQPWHAIGEKVRKMILYSGKFWGI